VSWIYQNSPIDKELVDLYAGMVYIITNLKNDRKYIGKKTFKFSQKKKIKGRMRRVLVDSDFEKYWGSNQELLNDIKELGEENFKREILYLCKNKSQMSYYEAREQFARDVLLNDEYYNSWIVVKVRQSNALRS
jgi:hypothetical protein